MTNNDKRYVELAKNYRVPYRRNKLPIIGVDVNSFHDRIEVDVLETEFDGFFYRLTIYYNTYNFLLGRCMGCRSGLTESELGKLWNEFIEDTQQNSLFLIKERQSTFDKICRKYGYNFDEYNELIEEEKTWNTI